MAKRYFANFPKVTYNGQSAVNIVTRAAVREYVFDVINALHPYTVKDGDRVDTIAFLYYDNQYYDWIVNFSNQIIDPYYDWPLDQDAFNEWIEDNYGYRTSFQTTHHYVNTSNGDIVITPQSYDYQTEQSEWQSVSVYDYFDQQNENKRQIKLIDKQFSGKIEAELYSLFNS